MSKQERASTTPPTELVQTLKLDSASRGRKWLRRLIVGLLILAGLVFIGTRMAARQGSGPDWLSADIERGDLSVSVVATGRLQARNTVEVGAEISGRLSEVKVDFNQQVNKGQVLALIDPEQQRARVRQAEANHLAAKGGVTQAQVALQEAQRNLERLRPLTEQDMSPLVNLDNAQSAVDRAEAALTIARAQQKGSKAQLDLASNDLDRTIIRSPIDGVVLSRNVEPGQTVVSALQAQLLFVLAEDLTNMELLLDIDEADIGQITEGMSAEFTVDAHTDRSFDATIVSLRNNPRIIANLVSYEGVLQVSNNAGLLKPGMTATASIVTAERQGVMLIPNIALRFRPPDYEPEDNTKEDRKVWVLVDGQLTARGIETGLSDGQKTELLSGELQVGDKVVTSMATDDRQARAR